MKHPDLRLALGVLAGLSVAGALAACGLISSDVTDFDLTLPDKKFSIDTDGWQIKQSDANAFTMTSCSSNATICSTAVTTACPMGCTGTCNPAKTCDLSLDVSVVQPVNLLTERPDLKTISDQSVIKVAIDSVTYEVTSNTLNVDTPPISVYIAPMSVVKVDAKNTQIKMIGTIPAVHASQKTTGPQPVQLTATGKADLQNIMATFKTPFNVLVGSSILITAGQAVPTGKLDAVVHITGHAGL